MARTEQTYENLEERVEALEDAVFKDDDSSIVAKIVRVLQEAGAIADEDDSSKHIVE